MEAAVRAQQRTQHTLVTTDQEDQRTGHRAVVAGACKRVPRRGFSAVAGVRDLGYNTRPPRHKMGFGMAKSKPVAGNRAKSGQAPARSATGTARKAVAKPKAAAKAAKKPAATSKKAPAKATRAVAKKAAPSKPVAKKAAPARPAPQKKAVPAKAAPQKKAAAAKAPPQKKPVPAKPAPSTRSKASPVGNSVTTSKPQTAAAKGGKSTKMPPPPIEAGVTMQDGRFALSPTVQIDLPDGYKPSQKEEYMSPRQLQYFRNKLSTWRADLVEESRQTIESLRDEVRDVGDEAERATRETENSLELRTRDRYRKLIAKIDKALKRIEEGRYGFCEETDEEIGIDRLEARPIATLSLDAQERWEHRQKQMGD